MGLIRHGKFTATKNMSVRCKELNMDRHFVFSTECGCLKR